jgi:hypothetical protein
MNSLAKLLVGFMFLFVTSAQAKFLIEPYAGYGMSTLTATSKPSGTKISTENNGLGLGARAGYVLPMGLWFAADYVTFLETDLKYKEPSGLTDGKVSGSAAYIDVGFDVPAIPLRFWAGYAFMDNAQIKGTSSTTDYTGTGYKAGLGFKPIPMMSLNLEYMMHMHDKYKTSSGSEGDVSSAYDDYKASTIFLSVSVPFML